MLRKDDHKWRDKLELLNEEGIEKEAAMNYLAGAMIGFPTSLFVEEFVRIAFKIEDPYILFPAFVGAWALSCFIPGKSFEYWAKFVEKQAKKEATLDVSNENKLK